jgi:alkylhydroperoxidase/carboxymuconolactone decarboxylase family protein YurZ
MPNIRLLELDEIKDPKIREMIRQAEARGAPDPNFFRLMGHVPELCTRMYDLWTESFNRGSLDHRLKELVRVKMSRYVACQY